MSDAYVPPVTAERLSCPVEIGDPLTRIHWRQSVYKGKVVDFSIEVQAREDEHEGAWITAFRVDTSHGEVHHHQYYRSGKQERRHTVAEIPVQGWDFVDAAWDEWLERMLDDREIYRRRWSDG